MKHWFVPKPQPDVYWFGSRISEPVTAITGIMIAACCGYALWHIETSSPLHQYMWYFFLLLGLSNLVSAVFGHALLHRFSHNWKAPGWVLGMLGSSAVAQAAILHADTLLPDWLPMVLTCINLTVLTASMWYTLQKMHFKAVEIHAALSLLGILLPVEFYLLLQHDYEASFWMVCALIPAVVAVLLHITKFTPSRWLNFFDIGHLLLCITVWCFMLATQRF